MTVLWSIKKIIAIERYSRRYNEKFTEVLLNFYYLQWSSILNSVHRWSLLRSSPRRAIVLKRKKRKKKGWRSKVFKWASWSRRLARREQSCSVLECLYESWSRSWSRWGCRNAVFAKNSPLGCRSCPNCLSSLFDKHRGSSLTRTNKGICWIYKNIDLSSSISTVRIYCTFAEVHIQILRHCVFCCVFCSNLFLTNIFLSFNTSTNVFVFDYSRLFLLVVS